MAQEVEVRSMLNAKNAIALSELFTRELGEPTLIKRFVLVHVGRPDFYPDPSRNLDLKVRTDGSKVLVTAKLGSWHDAATRTEIEFPVAHEHFESVVRFIHATGYDHFVAMYQVRKRWSEHPRVITLDNFMLSGHHILEVEELVDECNDSADAEQRVRSFLKQYGCEELDSNGTRKYIEEINSTTSSQLTIANVNLKQWLMERRSMIDCLE